MRVFNSFQEIIDFAINQEIRSIKFYKMLSDFVEQSEIAEVLSDLALVELGHMKKLEAIKAGKIILKEEEAGNLGIVSHVEDTEPDARMDYIDLLKIGMKKEETSRKLYTDLAKTIQTMEIQNIFLKLANEEAQHKMRFELEYDLRTF